MKKIYITILYTIISCLPSFAYKLYDVIMTKEGDMGVVFHVDQEKVLLISVADTTVTTQFCTESSFESDVFAVNDMYDFRLQGQERTQELLNLSGKYEFPILKYVPTERGWFIPSAPEIQLLRFANRMNSTLSKTLELVGGNPLDNANKYLTCTLVRYANTGIQCCLGSDNYSYDISDEITCTIRPLYRIDLTDEEKKSNYTCVWSTGSTSKSIIDFPQKTTTYTVTITNNENSCKGTDSRTVVVTNDGPQEFSDTICEGETYRKYGFNETKSGDYSTTISNGNCSTEVILHLTVAPKYKQEFNDVACLGQVYNKHGFTMTPFVKGEFHDTLTFLSHMGCDSMVILNLNVKPITYDTITRRICQNEHYKDANFDIAVNQNTGLSYYTVEKSKEDGCKSYLTLALQVDSVYQVTVVEDFEKSGSFNQYGFNIDEMKPGNNYRLELSTGNGCDSIVTLCFRLPADIDVDIDVDKDDRVIPTAFTPHFQDDMNDHFMPGYEVYIYDRYGNLVCHSEDGWDGTYRGEVATAGIYVYAVVMKDGEMRKGTIEVVKSK